MIISRSSASFLWLWVTGTYFCVQFAFDRRQSHQYYNIMLFATTSLFHLTGPYDSDVMMNYRSLEAYNNFKSGHVRELQVLIEDMDSPTAFIRAKVIPGMELNGNMNLSMILRI